MNSTEPVHDRVIRIVSQSLALAPAQVTPSARLEDLARDSVELFGLILAFEQDFNAQVQYEDLVHIETVGDIIQYVERKAADA